MARNQTLLKILTDTRAEARLSLNAAHNIGDREAQITLIQREQERLWSDFDWPHLIVDRYVPVEIGRRYYDPAVAYDESWTARLDLTLERMISVAVFDGGIWREMCYGIGDEHRYSRDSYVGATDWPARRWSRAEDDLVEIWPSPKIEGIAPGQQLIAPNMQGVLRFRGVRNLRPFRDDSDVADLDDRLLALYCAAALLAEAGAKDTELKMETAKRHYDRLKADQSQPSSFSIAGRDPLALRHPQWGWGCGPRPRGL